MAASTDAPHRTLTWHRLLRVAAVADLLAMVVFGAVLRDPSSVAFAAVILAGILMLRIRSGIAGVVMLGVVLIDSAVFMVPAAFSNVVNRETLGAVLIPASVAIISVTGGIAAVVSMVRRSSPQGGRAAAVVPQAAIAVFVVAAIAGLLQRGDASQAARPGDVVIEVGSLSYTPETVQARTGSIAIAARNTDLFWHTITIDRLKFDLGTPVGATRRATLRAQPGDYRFYCRVPGHAAAGMEGTLRVS